MNQLRVINIIENCKPNDLDGSDVLIVTGITVSTLREAVRLSKSARENGIVTVGIPPHNFDMGEFRKYFDTVIISQAEAESVTKTISAIVNKSYFNIRHAKELLRNAGTVYFVEGSAQDFTDATKNAAEMLKDAKDAKCILAGITTSSSSQDVTVSEMEDASRILRDTCTEDTNVFWAVIDEHTGDNVKVSVFAVMNDKGYKRWEDFFMYESDKAITEMIENGLDEEIRISLGSEKSFFEACLMYGTPELVRKFISKGHSPKDLEVDGVFPENILEDCIYRDICARNSDMLQILLEAGISLNNNCLGTMPEGISPKTLKALIDYGADPNSRGRTCVDKEADSSTKM